ncbi:hypothetical protein BT69DRAFT_1315195 [Atractiella rhizophila]|nr:hypothetical protein BT69DRAFT_1315195 [Atractiella rhizophila]
MQLPDLYLSSATPMLLGAVQSLEQAVIYMEFGATLPPPILPPIGLPNPSSHPSTRHDDVVSLVQEAASMEADWYRGGFNARTAAPTTELPFRNLIPQISDGSLNFSRNPESDGQAKGEFDWSEGLVDMFVNPSQFPFSAPNEFLYKWRVESDLLC